MSERVRKHFCYDDQLQPKVDNHQDGDVAVALRTLSEGVRLSEWISV